MAGCFGDDQQKFPSFFFGATPAVTFFMCSIVMITVLQEHEISHLLNSADLETTP